MQNFQFFSKIYNLFYKSIFTNKIICRNFCLKNNENLFFELKINYLTITWHPQIECVLSTSNSLCFNVWSLDEFEQQWIRSIFIKKNISNFNKIFYQTQTISGKKEWNDSKIGRNQWATCPKNQVLRLMGGEYWYAFFIALCPYMCAHYLLICCDHEKKEQSIQRVFWENCLPLHIWR